MLEGPVRPFLQVAEHRELARTGPFTTLSGSLGQIVIQLHTGALSHLLLGAPSKHVYLQFLLLILENVHIALWWGGGEVDPLK